jgi:hypothetical protein
VSAAIREHVWLPDPDDVLGQACRVCPLGRSHAVHIDPAEVPADTRYEQEDADGR